MAIDPSIPLQAKAPQMWDPLEQYGQMQTLKANQLAMQGGQRKMAMQDAFRNALASGADLNDPAVVNKLMAIDPTSAMAMQKQQGELKKTSFQTSELGHKVLMQKLGFLAADPSDEAVVASLRESVAQGLISPEAADSQLQRVMRMPLAARSKFFTETAIDAKARFQGGITMRGQDLSAATTRRGQDMADARARVGQGASATGGASVSGAQTQMAQGVARLRGILDELNKRKALRGGKASGTFGGDFIAGVGASGVGQAFQGAFSTEEQKLRDEYNAVAMSLLPAYMAAQGLGSKQMDTPEERRMMLKAFGSPELTYEANVAQLNALSGGAGATGWTGSAGRSQRPSDKATVDFNSLK